MPTDATLGGRALVWAVGAVLGVAILLGGLALGMADGRAALGAALAAVMVIGFFASGAIVLNAVARVMPTAALLIALMTYSLQVVMIGVVFVVVRRVGLVGSGESSSVDSTWLGVSIIVLTLVWMTATTIAAMRQRIPIYHPSSHLQVGAK